MDLQNLSAYGISSEQLGGYTADSLVISHISIDTCLDGQSDRLITNKAVFEELSLLSVMIKDELDALNEIIG